MDAKSHRTLIDGFIVHLAIWTSAMSAMGQWPPNGSFQGPFRVILNSHPSSDGRAKRTAVAHGPSMPGPASVELERRLPTQLVLLENHPLN